ncbi:hypothetical protein GO293_02279 [Ralstonia solanacearum]|nr:hypothetical protein [Ralstonia solanacearum]
MYLPIPMTALEMLVSIWARRPNGDVGQRERWTDEAALAQWLREPFDTLKAGGSMPFACIGVALGDRLDEHMVALVGCEADTGEDAVRFAEARWTSLIPALGGDDYLAGFNRSLNLETELAAHAVPTCVGFAG